MSRGKHFSKEELEFIKVNSMVMPLSEIAEKLGRNYYSIYKVARAFGVSRNHQFTPKEDFIIRRMYKDYGAKTIATKLGIDENSVYNRARKLGLCKWTKKK